MDKVPVSPFESKWRKFPRSTDYNRSLFDMDASLWKTRPLINLMIADLYKAQKGKTTQCQSNQSNLEFGKHDYFKIHVEVEDFEPDELEVKVIYNFIVVEGKHHEVQKSEHSLVSRQFQRRYKIPEDVDPDTLVCCLKDSVLSITAPKKTEPPSHSKEKIIPIICTMVPPLRGIVGEQLTLKDKY